MIIKSPRYTGGNLQNSLCIPLQPDPFWLLSRPKSQIHKNNHQVDKLVL